ncbi:hypothetical protein [Desulfuromonas sp. TF]|uniref:hypothetical protein n=1 Tax=Desulfuromonas sp. TF TaxID=1232410 RepID=UPI000400631A|nr:hypothetical protein [Desulfuromonas sp. TF]
MKKINAIVISRPTKIRGKLAEPGRVIELPSEKTEKEARDELLSLVGMGKALPATEENIAFVKNQVAARAATKDQDAGKSGGSAGGGKKGDKALADLEKRLAVLEDRADALDKREAALEKREKALEQK